MKDTRKPQTRDVKTEIFPSRNLWTVAVKVFEGGRWITEGYRDFRTESEANRFSDRYTTSAAY